MAREHVRLGARARCSSVVADTLFLSSVVVLSFVLYVGGLGFYSDDWVFLAILRDAGATSLDRLVANLYVEDPVIRQRPVQIVYLAVLYRLFGVDPLPYHALNAAALVAAAVLLYLVMRELRQPRALAVAVASVYALLPNYSTDRFWVASHQATLSIVFLLLATNAQLASLRGSRRRFIALAVLAVGSLVASGLAYETTLPLLALVAVLSFLRTRQLSGEARETASRRLRLLIPVNVAVLAAVVGFKAATSVRVGAEESYLPYLSSVVSGALRVNFAVYGVGLPYVLGWIVSHVFDLAVFTIASIVGVLVAAYLSRGEGPSGARGRAYVVIGLLTFVLGYAVFLVPTDVSFSSVSLDNRIAIAAALGVAVTFVGALSLLASALFRELWARRVFAAGVGVVCASGVIITNTLARFWESAYREQREIVAAMRADLPALAPGTVVVLDGVCLERGGAYVFTGKRDVTGRLHIAYRTRPLRGSAVTNVPRIRESGLSIFTFREPDFFRYGRHLFVYNYGERRTYRLSDVKRARRYFARSEFDPREDCLPGFAWRGPAPPLD